jgi:hypothetical protein
MSKERGTRTVAWHALAALLVVTALVHPRVSEAAHPSYTASTVASASTSPPDPVIAAAGDIACDPAHSSFAGGAGTANACRQRATSDLLAHGGLTAVLTLGDNQYHCGGYRAWLSSYDGSWGRVKSITHPAVGNHEYLTSGGTDCTSANAGAAGYFDYFNGIGHHGGPAGARGSGYYSFDVGAWHLIALNSNCGDAGGCGSTSPQGKWLTADLAAHPDRCTLAYWHIPLFSSGGRAAANSRPFWTALHAASADVVLAAHDHTYERFAPQRADGKLDAANGIRQFVVGTGGANHTTFPTRKPNSEVRNADTFGVLLLTLHSTGYSWRFQPEAGGRFTDSGSEACHHAGGAITPPSPPAFPAPRSEPQPVIRLLGNGARRALRRKAILVRVSCPTEACTVTARGTISTGRGGRAHRLRSARARVAPGRERRLRLRLLRSATRALRRAVARSRSAAASVNVAVRYDSGPTRAVYRKLRLRR